MKIEDVQIQRKPLVLAKPKDVEALESRLWITFPQGYRPYITRLGEGVLSSFIRIYPPWRIETELPEWRRRINKYWFWDKGRKLLPKDRALECVIVGDTETGDELVFHPCRPGRLFILPRESEQIFDAGTDLLSAIEWMCRSGRLTERIEDLTFEPFDSRKIAADQSSDRKAPADPDGESLDDLLELGKRWAQRHSARAQAGKDLKKHVAAGQTPELLYESFMIDVEPPLDRGYAAAWRIVDKSSKLEVGVFRWNMGADSYGSSYEPNNANLAKLRRSKSK